MKKNVSGLLLIAGLLLGAYGLYVQSGQNQIVKIGSLTVKQSMEENINWMMVAGLVMAVAGLVGLLMGRRG